MVEHLSAEAYRAMQAEPKRSKYRAKRCELDGVKFASKREAERFAELKIREKAGEIAELKLQHRFQLCGESHDVITHYIADFFYLETGTGKWIVEDAKGIRTPVYALKRKWLKADWHIEIREV
jgi:hypothetical protein